ncbi:MAG: XTP/dITP diphosphatase [Firmicutes bacterium]|nr:XTP/dITP diphosphatase [Bacillota bacterium]
MTQLLIATTNKHKFQEVCRIFSECGLTGWEPVPLSAFPFYEAPEEDGATFGENAVIKAAHAAAELGMMTLADDSGLAVDALDGAPGIYSARYADDESEGHDDAANRRKLLREMADVPEEKRGAAFICAAALADPKGEAVFIEGRCEGIIAREEVGENGFGYDCLFYLPQFKATMAQISEDEKNAVSHRGKAMRKMAALLTDIKNDTEQHK